MTKLGGETIKNKIFSFLKILFPSNKTESVLFLILMILYLPLGIWLSLNTTVIYNKKIPWDIYFSFDNRSIILSGGMIEKHPFSEFFITPVYNLAVWVYQTVDDFRFFSLTFTVLCAVNVSLGIVLIYKYLRNIIKLETGISLLIVVFYTFFSTNILLSFTPETYTFTIFLLSFYVYISALILSQGKRISVFFASIMGIFIGGETITNLPKTFIPFLFENKKINVKYFVNPIVKALVSAAIFILLYLWRRDWDYMKIIVKSTSQYEKFSNPKGDTWLDMVTTYFFGGSVLFPSFIERNLRFFKIHYKGLYFQVYDNFVQYLFVFLIFAFMLAGLVANRKNKLTYILWISFLLDVIIHCFMKFGLWTSYLYGGHWVFVVPLLTGWLFFACKENKMLYRSLYLLFSVMTVYLIVNNLYRLADFLDFVKAYYLISNT
jgi:hypothetical protein